MIVQVWVLKEPFSFFEEVKKPKPNTTKQLKSEVDGQFFRIAGITESHFHGS